MTSRLLPVLAVLASAATSASVASAEPAKSADGFVDAFGVNVHLSFDGTPYVDHFADIIVPELTAIGVRHVRDGCIISSQDDPYYVSVRALVAKGIGFSLITAMDTSFGKATDYAMLPSVYAWSNGGVDWFEGINEPDLNALPNTNWVTTTQAAQAALYMAVKSDPTLTKLPVVGPSVTSLNNALMQIGDIGASLDYGNGHPYPGGFCPTCGTFYGQTVDTWLPQQSADYGGKPMVMTETGYHTNVNQPHGPDWPVSELAEGKYTPRLLFEFYNRGFVRTYLYELIDEASDPGLTETQEAYGLLRNDGSEKPAATAMKNIVATLADPGPAFTLGALDLTIGGDTANVHHSVLEKRDGTFFVALWIEAPDWDTGFIPNSPTDDPSARMDLTVPDQAVTLTVGGSFAGVTLHTLDATGAMTSTTAALAGGQLAMMASDTVTLVELTPPMMSSSSASGAGGATATSGTGGAAGGGGSGGAGGASANGGGSAGSGTSHPRAGCSCEVAGDLERPSGALWLVAAAALLRKRFRASHGAWRRSKS